MSISAVFPCACSARMPTPKTPCVGHCTRGISACRCVSDWHVSRCRQAPSSARSKPAISSPHSGHGHRVGSCSTQIHALVAGLEVHARHVSRRGDPQNSREQLGVLHPLLRAERSISRTSRIQSAAEQVPTHVRGPGGLTSYPDPCDRRRSRKGLVFKQTPHSTPAPSSYPGTTRLKNRTSPSRVWSGRCGTV